MFRDDCAVAAYLKTKLMTDAMVEAVKISMKVMAEMKAMGKDHHRENIAIGDRKTSKNASIVPARKNANMMCEQIFRMFRISVSVEGKAIVAPDKSSSRMTWTILNQ